MCQCQKYINLMNEFYPGFYVLLNYSQFLVKSQVVCLVVL